MVWTRRKSRHSVHSGFRACTRTCRHPSPRGAMPGSARRWRLRRRSRLRRNAERGEEESKGGVMEWNGSNLVLVGCPLVNDAMLARAVQQQPCLVHVWVKDCARISRDSLAYALCDSEDLQGIVAQLNDPRQSAADAQRCCLAFHVLLALAPEGAAAAPFAEAQAAGALDALLRCAALHATHAGAQAPCCYALSEYVYRAKDTEVASYPPIFLAAVAALKAHPLDRVVQRAALSALSNACCYGLDGTPAVPALLDAIPLVLAAMRAFPTDLEVQEYGCDSLFRMCKLDASVAEAVATSGALGLFIKALHLDNADDDTLVAAVKAIGAIALSPAALPQATVGIDAVIWILGHPLTVTLLAEAACITLGTYLRCAATRERAVQAGAEAAIREALAKHGDNAELKKAAEDALQVPQA